VAADEAVHVLSTQPAKFQAATFKGDQETNLARIAPWLRRRRMAIRDPKLIDWMSWNGSSADTSWWCRDWHRPGVGEEGPRSPIPIHLCVVRRLSASEPCAGRGAIQRRHHHRLVRGIVKTGVDHTQAMDWLAELCASAASPQSLSASAWRSNRSTATRRRSSQRSQGLELSSDGRGQFRLLLDTFHMNIEDRISKTASGRQ